MTDSQTSFDHKKYIPKELYLNNNNSKIEFYQNRDHATLSHIPYFNLKLEMQSTNKKHA